MTYTAKAFNNGVVIETTETDSPKDIKQMFKRYGENACIRVWSDGVKMPLCKSNKMFLSELIANPSMDRLGGMK